jgi:hypothetical protein
VEREVVAAAEARAERAPGRAKAARVATDSAVTAAREEEAAACLISAER